MKIYLSAMFRHREQLRKIAAELERHGHVITSRWLKPETDGNNDASNDRKDWAKWAMQDIADDDACEAYVMLTEPPYDENRVYHMTGRELNELKRGGRHFETGYSFAEGKRIILLGPSENAFHALFEEYETLPELIAALSAPCEAAAS